MIIQITHRYTILTLIYVQIQMQFGAVGRYDSQNFPSTFCDSSSLIYDKALLNLVPELLRGVQSLQPFSVYV